MNSMIKKLRVLREEEILRDIDLQFCEFLQGRHDSLSDQVLLAAGLTSYLYGQGHICLWLQDYAGRPLFEEADSGANITAPEELVWKQALQASPIVGSPGDFKPLIMDTSGRLYLQKPWRHEQILAEELIDRGNAFVEETDIKLLREGLNRLFSDSGPGAEVDWQRVAAAVSLLNRLSIISGGPGTGKTTTVVRIIALLLEQAVGLGTAPAIALAAPTGKAAARLQEAVTSAKRGLITDGKIVEAIPENAVTLHQLLGASRHTAHFRHDRENPLPYDIVVVDEVSMVDQTMMSKLLQALMPDTRLILLGDRDQLASVEAGSVLGDICMQAENRYSGRARQLLERAGVSLPGHSVTSSPGALTDNITLLTRSYRFDPDSGIARLAESVNSGKVDESFAILSDPAKDDATLNVMGGLPAFRDLLTEKVDKYFTRLLHCRSPQEAFELLDRFQILAAHRRGPWGVGYINQLVEQVLKRRSLVPAHQQWYKGRPVIITANDYSLGLYNGDIGVCMPDREGELRLYFPGESNTPRQITSGRLPAHSRAFALTIHKSQGSEFDRVLLVLPEEPSRIVSRELIYTAITRARTSVEIISTKKTLQAGIHSRLHRMSGLANRIWSA